MRRMAFMGALCLSTVLALSGCQAPTEEAQPEKNETEKSSLASIDDIRNAAATQQKAKNTYSDIKDSVTTLPADYSDDVAWVRVGSDYALIDLSGNVLFTLSEKLPGTSFLPGNKSESDRYPAGSLEPEPYRNGVSVVNGTLIDKEGNAIWSSTVEGKAEGEKRYGESAFKEARLGRSVGGYTQVIFDVDCFDYTGTITGIIDPKGNWVVEPWTIEEAAADLELGPEVGTNRGGLAGESDYCLGLDRRGILVIRTGEFIPWVQDFENSWGYIVAGSFDGKTASSIHAAENAIAHKNRMYIGSGEFVGEDGEVTLDINDLGLVSGGVNAGNINGELAYADSDYCLVTLQNSGGGQYATLIDLDGNRMFDPLPAEDVYEFNSIGFFYQPNPDEPGWYLDVHGNKLGSVTGYEGESFRCGRAWMKVNGKWECVNEKGEIAF